MGAGKSKATGQSAKRTNAPLASEKNQLALKRLQRSKKPKRSNVQAKEAPIRVPKVFSTQSTFEGTRAGKKSCSVSKPSDNKEPASTASTAARPAPEPHDPHLGLEEVMGEAALAWVRQQPTIAAPIASARTVEQLHQFAADVRLSADELAYLAQ